MNLKGDFTVNAQPGQEFTDVREEYDRWFNEFQPWDHTQRAPLQFDIQLPVAINAQVNTDVNEWNEIRILYGDDIGIPIASNDKDLHQD
jgi:hypothetical protein